MSRQDDLALQIAVQRGKQAELSAQAPGAQNGSSQGRTRMILVLVSEYMGVSKNKGTPKWMVYNEKPY